MVQTMTIIGLFIWATCEIIRLVMNISKKTGMTLKSPFTPFYKKETKSEPGEILEKALEKACDTNQFCPVRDGKYQWVCQSSNDIECSRCRREYFLNEAKKQGNPDDLL